MLKHPKFSRRWVIYIGLVVQSLAFLLAIVDPGSMIGSAGSKCGIMIVAMSVYGFGWGFVLIPLLPEILEATRSDLKARKVVYNEKAMEDYLSCYYKMSESIGYVVGPALSSQLRNIYSFTDCGQIMLAILAYFTIIYITACGFYDDEVSEKEHDEVELTEFNNDSNQFIEQK